MRIMVTGGTGFVGGPVVDLLLRQGHDVMVISRHAETVAARWPDALRLAADDMTVNKLRTLSRFGPETFLHMAWEDLPNYSAAVSCRNLELGAHYLSLALQLGVSRVVGVGSCLEYGICRGAQKENRTPAEYPDSFAQAKAALHAVIRSACTEDGLAYRWVRPFFVYGEGQRATSLIPSALRAARVGKRLALRDKSAAVDFVHVTDVARGICTLTTDPGPSGAFNLGSGSPHSAQWVVDTVMGQVSGANAVENVDSDASEYNGWWADISLVQSTYGWSPTMSVEEGIRQFIAAVNH